MKRLALLAVLALAACAPPAPAITPVVMPHPREAGAYLLLLTGQSPGQINLGRFDLNTPAGLRAQVIRIFGERCAQAEIVVDERIQLGPAVIGDDLHVQAVKVRCPS